MATEYGHARSLVESAALTRDLNQVTKAVRVSPSDPEPHFLRGLILNERADFISSLDSLVQASRLRPYDHSIWLALGTAREQGGDAKGAIDAFAEAVRLAPYYARPHWELGNALLRNGARDEAFTQLRRAAQSDPLLLPSFFELTWAECGGDGEQVVNAVNPQSEHVRLALSRFLTSKGALDEAKDLLSDQLQHGDRERQRLIVKLIRAGKYADAQELWLVSHATDALITDGSFEQFELSLTPGFYWQTVRDSQHVKIAIEQGSGQSGSASLRLQFLGATNSPALLVKQLIIVRPNTRYELTLAARSELLSGTATPLVVVREVEPSSRALATVAPVSHGNADWKNYATQFVTSENTEAVYIVVTREKCQKSPCELFGNVWLDSFTLRRV